VGDPISCERPRGVPSTYMRFHGAFVVNPAALADLEKIILGFVSLNGAESEDLKHWVTVWTAKAASVQYADVAEVIALRNPRSDAIRAIRISAVRPGRRAQVLVDDQGNGELSGVVFEADGDPADALSQTASRIVDEQRNIRAWYAIFRRACEPIGLRLKRAKRSIVVPVSIGIFAVSVGGLVMLNQAEKQRVARYETALRNAAAYIDKVDADMKRGVVLDDKNKVALEALRAQVASSPATLPRTTAKTSVWSYLSAVLIGMFGPVVFISMFPRVIFEIGEGKQRHDRVKTLRNCALVTVLLSGVALPLLRRALGW
jgi:hypothetical protein